MDIWVSHLKLTDILGLHSSRTVLCRLLTQTLTKAITVSSAYLTVWLCLSITAPGLQPGV
jgi:hypothetical protein